MTSRVEGVGGKHDLYGAQGQHSLTADTGTAPLARLQEVMASNSTALDHFRRSLVKFTAQGLDEASLQRCRDRIEHLEQENQTIYQEMQRPALDIAGLQRSCGASATSVGELEAAMLKQMAKTPRMQYTANVIKKALGGVVFDVNMLSSNFEGLIENIERCNFKLCQQLRLTTSQRETALQAIDARYGFHIHMNTQIIDPRFSPQPSTPQGGPLWAGPYAGNVWTTVYPPGYDVYLRERSKVHAHAAELSAVFSINIRCNEELVAQLRCQHEQGEFHEIYRMQEQRLALMDRSDRNSFH